MNLAKLILERPHPRFLTKSTKINDFIRKLCLRIYFEVFKESEYFSPSLLRQIQEVRVMDLLKRARKTPFYREHLKNVRTIEDFYSLPALGKHEMRKGFDDGTITNPLLSEFKHPRSTSGSSGIPFVFFHDKNMYTRRVALYHRLLRWAGYEKGDVAVWIMREMHPEFGAIPFVCFGPDDIEKRKEELYALFTGKNVILHAMTSHLVFVSNLLENDNKKFNFKSIISYAEPLPPEVRLYLEEKFSAPIFDNYGSQEILNPANDCEYHNGFHINSEWTLLEVLDADSKPLPPGQLGTIALTSFDNEYMPFIRYKNGDLGYIVDGPCPCGRTLPRVKITGRDVHYFIHPKGTVGDFISLVTPILKLTPKILEFQITRHDRMSYTLSIVPTSQYDKTTETTLLQGMKDYLGSDITLNFEIIETIPLGPGGKPRVFINLENDLPMYSGT